MLLIRMVPIALFKVPSSTDLGLRFLVVVDEESQEKVRAGKYFVSQIFDEKTGWRSNFFSD